MDINIILDIESRYHLYTDEIDGVAYWMFLRFGILQYQIISEILKNQPRSFTVHNKWTNRLHTATDAAWASFLNHKIHDTRSDIVFFAHPRRIAANGTYREIYTDKLAEEYNAVSIIQENHRTASIASPRPVFYYDFYYRLKLALNRRISIIFCRQDVKRIKDEVRKHLSRPLEEIAEAYDIDINFESIYQQAVDFILHYKIEHDHCLDLLRKTKPKILITVVHYGGASMFMCEAARKLGIKVIELQHGSMHTEHIGYHYRTNENLLQLPDYLFTFSNYWSDQIEMPAGSTKIIPTGFPYYDEQRDMFKSHNKTAENPRIILFISQGTIDDKLSIFATELSSKLDPKHFRIIYKLHPDKVQYWREMYRSLADAHDNGRLEVVDDPKESIYKYFALSSIQVGVYSTAIYEGIGFGLDTYIYNISHASAMSGLIKKSYARYVNNTDEMMNFLEHYSPSSRQQNSLLWCPNAKENIKEAISKIIAMP